MWMDQTYRVALIGHRDFDGHKTLDERLYPLLRDLIRDKPFVEIYIGRNGEFDRYGATVVKRAQKSFGKDNNALLCLLAYPMKDMEFFVRYYDGVMIPECAQSVHPKRAIERRNRWMVERADLLICYVEREYGGAYAAMKYAMALGKKIINLSEPQRME